MPSAVCCIQNFHLYAGCIYTHDMTSTTNATALSIITNTYITSIRQTNEKQTNMQGQVLLCTCETNKPNVKSVCLLWSFFVGLDARLTLQSVCQTSIRLCASSQRVSYCLWPKLGSCKIYMHCSQINNARPLFLKPFALRAAQKKNLFRVVFASTFWGFRTCLQSEGETRPSTSSIIMIALISLNSSSVPLIQGLCSSSSCESEFSALHPHPSQMSAKHLLLYLLHAIYQSLYTD